MLVVLWHDGDTGPISPFPTFLKLPTLWVSYFFLRPPYRFFLSTLEPCKVTSSSLLASGLQHKPLQTVPEVAVPSQPFSLLSLITAPSPRWKSHDVYASFLLDGFQIPYFLFFSVFVSLFFSLSLLLRVSQWLMRWMVRRIRGGGGSGVRRLRAMAWQD